QSLIGLEEEGQQQRGLLMMLLGGGGILGGIVGGFLANGLGRKRSLLISFAGAFVASFLLLKTNDTFTSIIYAETAFLALFFGISQGILTAYVPELFPKTVRSTATGSVSTRAACSRPWPYSSSGCSCPCWAATAMPSSCSRWRTCSVSWRRYSEKKPRAYRFRSCKTTKFVLYL